MLIISLNSPGVTRRKIENTGVNASGSAYIEFEDVLVPVENLLGVENAGFAIIMTNFLHGTLLSAMSDDARSLTVLICRRTTFPLRSS